METIGPPDLHKQPVVGLEIREPETVPEPGDVLLGYRVISMPKSTFTKPEPKKLGATGWISVALLAIIFWPVSCVPCCISACYPSYQLPVYGKGDANYW